MIEPISTVTRRWQWTVYARGALLVSTLAIVCFGGTFYGPEADLNGVHYAWYHHGWPWIFCGRCSDDRWTRFAFWLDITYWQSWALIADAAVFLAGTVGIVAATRALSRKGRLVISLRVSLCLVAVMCCVLAWSAATYSHGQRSRLLEDRFGDVGCSLYSEHRDPRWLMRLMGHRAICEPMFYRNGDCLHIGCNGGEPVIANKVLPILQLAPEIRKVAFHHSTRRADIPKFLQHISFEKMESVSILCDMEDIHEPLRGLGNCRGLKELRLKHVPLTRSEAKEIAKCSQLETIELWATGIDDQSLQLIGHISELKVVALIEEEVSQEAIGALEARGIKVIR